jgi:hypothetical protein
MDWHNVWCWVIAHRRSVSFGGVAATGVFALKAWRWFVNRYDGKVLALMSEAVRKACLEHPTMNIVLLPFRIEELGEALGRSRHRVYKSLRRLEAHGQTREVRNGEWVLGSFTQKEFLDRQWNQNMPNHTIY